MPAERTKLLWISISACVFVLIVLAAGFFLLAPKQGGASAPATVGNTAPPKAQDPQDFLSNPPTVPALEQPRSQDGGVIIVYGDKPALPAAAAGTPATPATPAAAATSSAEAAQGASGTAAAAAAAAAAAPAKAPAAKQAAPAKATPAVAKKSAPKAEAKKIDEYWIQAASFTSRGRADELKQGLAEKGVAALISVKDISGKSWYRVRIGPYSAKAEADGWLGRLKDTPGCAEAYVSKTTVALKPKP